VGRDQPAAAADPADQSLFLLRTERSLVGRRLDGPAIREAASLAAAAADPIDDLRGSADYKRAMAGVWTARALREVA